MGECGWQRRRLTAGGHKLGCVLAVKRVNHCASCLRIANNDMETTYTIIGADGQQYGPISLEQLKAWVAERRANPETKTFQSHTKSWAPAAPNTEIGMCQRIPPPAARAPP